MLYTPFLYTLGLSLTGLLLYRIEWIEGSLPPLQYASSDVPTQQFFSSFLIFKPGFLGAVPQSKSLSDQSLIGQKFWVSALNESGFLSCLLDVCVA